MSIVEAFSQVRVLCVGDVMLDRFILGAVKRISPESPVPVLSIGKTQVFPGGAANVARNIASLGGRSTLIGVVGADAVAAELERALSPFDGLASALVVAPERATTEKVRFVSQGQHLLRADQEDSHPISPELEERVLAAVASQIDSHHVLVLSDYAKGVLTARVVSGAIALAKARHIPVIVDPKSPEMARYNGATVVTPNAKEVQAATGIDPTEDDADAVLAGGRILEHAGIESVLVTRAHRGMSLISRTAEPVHLPASAREVFDVVGAGDTVIATLALAVGAGDTLANAAEVANLAAGIVVGKRGTATVSQSELLQERARIDSGHLAGLREKILSMPQALQRVAAWRRDGQSIGFTNGCFDLLHVGHLALLGYARDHCGCLVVGLNSDASSRRLKGPTRPINCELDRAMVLAALSTVDAVVLFDEDTPIEMMAALAPDVLFKGADYALDQIVGAEGVLARGGRVLTCEMVPGKGTSAVLETVRLNATPVAA